MKSKKLSNRRKKNAQERTGITADKVLARLDVESKGEGPDTSASARIKASELLGKHLGLFTDKVQVENVGAPPEIRVVFGKAEVKESDDVK